MSFCIRAAAPLLTLAVALGAVIQPAAQDESSNEQEVRAQKAIEGMTWLAGDWSGQMWGGTYHAYYSTPEGGRIISHSRLIQEEKLAFYEFEVFELRENKVHLQPYPGGRPADGFFLEENDTKARKAVFENPEKDYPTRIVYHRVSDTELVITLSDPHGESDKVETFELSR